MSQIDQVIAMALSLQNSGKQPSVATLKSKLKSVPMPVLIQGLQRFKSLSVQELQNIVAAAPTAEPLTETPSCVEQELAIVKSQLAKLQIAYDELLVRVTKLEQKN